MAFIGIQTGPRQFEFPPKILESDSAGRYCTPILGPGCSNVIRVLEVITRQRADAVRA